MLLMLFLKNFHQLWGSGLTCIAFLFSSHLVQVFLQYIEWYKILTFYSRKHEVSFCTDGESFVFALRH